MYINSNRGQIPAHSCIYHRQRSAGPYMPESVLLPGVATPTESSTISPFAQMLLMMGPGTFMGNMLDPTQQVPVPANGPQFGSSPAASAAVNPGARGDMSSLGPSTYDGIIQEAAAKYNLDPALLKAVIKKESHFNPRAGSGKGARGLMQLMPATFRAMGGRNALDPRQNIFAGAKYLSQMLKDHNGDVRLALAAYNAGPGNVRKYGGIPPFRETRNYVSVITADYQASLQSGARTLSV